MRYFPPFRLAWPGPRGGARRWRQAGRRGTAALEFAATSPVLLLMVVGAVDLGRAVQLRLKLEADLAAAVGVGLAKAAQVESTDGATVASAIAAVMGGNLGTTLTSGVVIVNDGPTVTITNGAAVSSGTAANANEYYCPTGSQYPWSWGTALSAGGSACAGGGYAGKFITVYESQSFTPYFSTYHLLPSNTIPVSAIVQVQ
jgi:Flp pilus assembly protein TadG